MRPSWVVLILLASGCAQVPVSRDVEPSALLREACAPGSEIQKASGSIWMKAASQEASGQFPATVEAVSPDRVRMEITNLLGGTEAIILVQGREYRIEVPGKPEKTEKGAHTWGGIPLEWATELFLGRIPCPPTGPEKRLSIGSEPGELVVSVPASLHGAEEAYVYRFRRWAGRPWPESLRWERKSAPPVAVEFKFDDPEEKTRSPRKWEAKSPRGEVKVRWKDRELR